MIASYVMVMLVQGTQAQRTPLPKLGAGPRPASVSCLYHSQALAMPP